MPEAVMLAKVAVVHRVRWSATRSSARMRELESQALDEICRHGEQLDGVMSTCLPDDGDAHSDYVRIVFSAYVIPYEKKDVTP